MMRAPSQATIHAAEMRVVQSRTSTLGSLRRVQGALRRAATRASTVAIYGGGALLLWSWLSRRPSRASSLARQGETAPARSSSDGRISGFILQFFKSALVYFLHQGTAAWLRNSQLARSPLQPQQGP